MRQLPALPLRTQKRESNGEGKVIFLSARRLPPERPCLVALVHSQLHADVQESLRSLYRSCCVAFAVTDGSKV